MLPSAYVLIGVTTNVLAAIINAIAPDNIRLPNLLPVINRSPFLLPLGELPALSCILVYYRYAPLAYLLVIHYKIIYIHCKESDSFFATNHEENDTNAPRSPHKQRIFRCSVNQIPAITDVQTMTAGSFLFLIHFRLPPDSRSP